MGKCRYLNRTSEYINDIIYFLYTIENRSIIDNKNTDEIKEILIKNQLLSINLLEELEINYF